MSLLVIAEFLGLFAKILTADDYYCLHNRENLPQPIQMQLSNKPISFFNFFAAFVSNFEEFGEKEEPHSSCISERN